MYIPLVTASVGINCSVSESSFCEGKIEDGTKTNQILQWIAMIL